jgi:hypothetical protein
MPAFARRIGIVLVALGCGAAGWATALSDSPRAAAVLLPDALVSQAAPETQADPTVVRSRYVAIDMDALPDPLRRGRLGREPALSLELFPDRHVVAVFERFDPAKGGVIWVGRVEGAPMSSVTLAYGGGLVAGSIVMPGNVFSIRPAPEGMRQANPQPAGELHVIAEIDQATFPREAPPIEAPLTPADIARAARVAPTDTADVIDVMVLYTAAAQANAGGAAGMVNLINLGMSETNTSYANSEIDQRIRLVHAAEVSYTEVSSFSTNLTSLRLGTGTLSGVAALRDAYRADLVTLLVHPPSPDACGIAYVMTSVSTAFAPFGFSVTDSACVANSTFAHELGHNMGAQHDWYVSTATVPFSYAHGYVNASVGQRWRTIMAYNDHCTAQGFSCTRTLHWSNPGVTYLPYCTSRGFNCALLAYWYFPGAAMGVPGSTNASCRAGMIPASPCDADNHRALNNTALTVANLRQAAPAAAR